MGLWQRQQQGLGWWMFPPSPAWQFLKTASPNLAYSIHLRAAAGIPAMPCSGCPTWHFAQQAAGQAGCVPVLSPSHYSGQKIPHMCPRRKWSKWSHWSWDHHWLAKPKGPADPLLYILSPDFFIPCHLHPHSFSLATEANATATSQGLIRPNTSRTAAAQIVFPKVSFSFSFFCSK